MSVFLCNPIKLHMCYQLKLMQTIDKLVLTNKTRIPQIASASVVLFEELREQVHCVLMLS